MVNDTVGDFIIRIQNGYMAGKKSLSAPYSRMNSAVADILVREGYVASVKTVPGASKIAAHKLLVVELLYENGRPALEHAERVSRSGQRIYAPADKLPRVMTGYGIAIISTSQGVMTDSQARKQHQGGEVLCKIW